jgi:hypothetical protein
MLLSGTVRQRNRHPNFLIYLFVLYIWVGAVSLRSDHWTEVIIIALIHEQLLIIALIHEQLLIILLTAPLNVQSISAHIIL